MRSYLIMMIFFAVAVNANTAENNSKSTGTTGWLGKKRCIVVNETRERFCNANAQKWCDDHKGAKECRRFENRSVKGP